jgi:hypothetical protein
MGDTFWPGRCVDARRGGRAEAVREEILRITLGHPMAVNLEFVIVTSLTNPNRVKDARHGGTLRSAGSRR